MEAVSNLFSFDNFKNAAGLLGALVVGGVILRELFGFLSGFRAFFLAPMGIGRLDLKKYGSWAVVTGASDGIGRGYALELAKRGLNVVLIALPEEKLYKVATEIKETYGRDTRAIPVDFSGGPEIYAPIANELSSLDIGVLVNNVGTSHSLDLMGNVPAQKLYDVVQINCQPVVQLSRILLPKMVAKGGGVIVNISSLTSLGPCIYNVVYAATKIYVKYIGEGIKKEYGAKGIIVQNVRPSTVSTSLLKEVHHVSDLKPNFFKPTPATFTRAAVATIGIQEETHGCFSHAIESYVAERVPTFVYDNAVLRIKSIADSNLQLKLKAETDNKAKAKMN